MPYFKQNFPRKPKPKPVRKRRTPPSEPIPTDLNGLDGSSNEFPSVKAAKRALAALIPSLPPRKSPDEPKRFWLVKLIKGK
jgi:hypothetical protein